MIEGRAVSGTRVDCFAMSDGGLKKKEKIYNRKI
jgi:hypothetical protein